MPQIFREAGVVFVVRPGVDESHPKIVALMNEYDCAAVLEVVAELTKIWKEVFEEAPDSVIEVARDPDLRLN